MADSSSADQPLGLSVHSMPSPQAAITRQRSLGRRQMLLVLLLCAAPVIASYFMYYVVRPGGQGTAYGTLIEPSVAMPPIEGRTLDGQPVLLRQLAGQWLMVVVDDAACPTECERRLYMQRQLREMLGRERDRVDKLWLVLGDAPVAPALREALEGTPSMNIVRVPRAAVEAWLKPEAGQPLSAHLYVVDPLGQWMMREPANPDPSKVKRDMGRLLSASAGWDQPGRQALIEDGTASATPAAGASAAAAASRR